MKCVWEHNGNDTLLYCIDYVGAYTRGSSLEIAMSKMNAEIESYTLWCGAECKSKAEIEIIQNFDRLEQMHCFLDNAIIEGSYDKLWSLRKVMRRFLWHDRIHAKAMYRMAVKSFGLLGANNTFKFDID